MKKFFSSKLNLALTCILLIAIIATLLLIFDVFKKDVKAIDFSNSTVEEINEWANENDISDKVSFTYEFDESVEINKVIYQSIKEGESCEDGISFIISKGKDPDALVTLIEVTDDLTKEQIESWFNTKGFTGVKYQYVLSDKVEGTVLSIDKTEAKTTDDILVTVSAFENEDLVSICVPDFSSLSKEDISAWVIGYQVKINYVYAKSDLEKDTFISQDPAKGEFVKPNDEVSITLADNQSSEKKDSGSINVSDDYIGYDETKFIDTIKGLGLNPVKGSKTYKNSKYKDGTVYSYQSSSDGYSFNSGDDVVYYLVNNEGSNDVVTVGDDYLGYEESKFISTIEGLGLKVSKQEKTYSSSKYKAGTIYAYDSSSDGIEFKKGDTVKYWLVSGETNSETVTVGDDYLGYEESKFISTIEGLGLKVSKQEKTYSSSKYKAGTIYAYDSSSDGINFKKGDTVKYWLVSGGSGNSTTSAITVPDTLLFKKEADFIAEIEKLGLKATKAGSKKSSNYSTGQVYAYDSTSDGITFKAGDSVKYYVVDNGDSSSSVTPTNNEQETPKVETVTLTNLVGKSQSEAESWCSSNGLTASVSTAYSNSVASGLVISMSPSSGSVNKGSTVNIIVSKGAETSNASILNPNMLISNYSKDSFANTETAIKNYLSGQGFSNVTVNGTSSDKTVGRIISISVNGNTAYTAGEYPTNTPIVVTVVNEQYN